MKNLYLISLIIATLMFVACEEEETSYDYGDLSIYDDIIDDDIIDDALNGESVQLNFTKTFEGQIDSKYDIVMRLISNSGNITGNYFYKNAGEELKLSGTMDKSGNFSLNEYNKKGSMTGVFSGSVSDNLGYVINGYWEKPDGSKTLNFSLTESYNEYASLKNKKIKNKKNKYDGEYFGEDSYDDYIKIKVLNNNRFEYSGSCLIERPSYATIKGKGTLSNNIGFSDDGTLTIRFYNNYIILEYSESSSGEFNGKYIKN